MATSLPTDETTPTIADFFQAQLAGLEAGGALKELEAVGQAVKIAPAALNKQIFERVLAAVLKQLRELIAIDIPRDVLAKAWSKYDELQEYRDTKKYPPGKLFKVVLVLEQTIRSRHEPSFKPVVEVLGKRIELDEIIFPIELELTVKGGEIGIRDARIVSLSIGSCQAKGEIKFKYGTAVETTLLKNEKALQFDRVFTFKDGVPLKELAEIAGAD